MKFKLFFLATIALIVGSCANNEIVDSDENLLNIQSKQQVLKITASFEESGGTRAILEEVGSTLLNPIVYKWQTTDVIQFSFVQGLTTLTNTTNVTSVSADGKTAVFDVTVPAGINATQPYKLYAYKSGRKSTITAGSVLNTNSTIAVLPNFQYDYNSTLDEQAILFSIWSEKEVPANSGSNIDLSFKHLGSMLTLNLKNIGTTPIEDLVAIGIRCTTPENEFWMYNRFEGGGGAEFDLATGSFVVGKEKKSYTMMIFPPSPTLAGNTVARYYVWFVPLPTLSSFTLTLATLKSRASDLSAITGMTGGKPINQNFVPGKNYVFFVHINHNPGVPATYTVSFKTSATF